MGYQSSGLNRGLRRIHVTEKVEILNILIMMEDREDAFLF